MTYVIGTYEPPPPRRRRWPLILTLVIGVPLAGIALLVGAGLLYVYTARDEPVTERDREVVLTAERVASYMDGFQPDSRHETLTKQKYLDGSYELEYEYDDERDGTPTIVCNVSVERTQKDAREAYHAYDIGASIGMRLGADTQFVDRDDLFRWGDQWRCALIRKGDVTVGHHFVARKGKLVFIVELFGLSFADQPALFGEMLGPCLEKLENYQP